MKSISVYEAEKMDAVIYFNENDDCVCEDIEGNLFLIITD